MPSAGYPLDRVWWPLHYAWENFKWSFGAWEQGQRVTTLPIYLLIVPVAIAGILGSSQFGISAESNWSDAVGFGSGIWLVVLLFVVAPARMWKAAVVPVV